MAFVASARLNATLPSDAHLLLDCREMPTYCLPWRCKWRTPPVPSRASALRRLRNTRGLYQNCHKLPYKFHRALRLMHWKSICGQRCESCKSSLGTPATQAASQHHRHHRPSSRTVWSLQPGLTVLMTVSVERLCSWSKLQHLAICLVDSVDRVHLRVH